MGHVTHAMLLNRPALPCFRAVYDFTRRHYHTPRTLWPSVYDELRAAFALLPVLIVSWSTPWSSTAGCSGASLFGYAVREAECKMSLVSEIGAWSDRWRFQLGAGADPRVRALGQDEWTDFQHIPTLPAPPLPAAPYSTDTTTATPCSSSSASPLGGGGLEMGGLSMEIDFNFPEVPPAIVQ